MLAAKSKLTVIPSITIAVLTVIAAGGGFFFPNVYRDAAVYGNDLVTLIVAVPLLTIASILARHGSLRARLVWMGMLHFTFYNYALYLFGTALNWFFLLYVALFTLPIFVLVFALAGTDLDTLRFDSRFATPVRWISGYMLVLAVLIAVAWIAQWVSYVAARALAAERENFIRTVGAVDISLLASGLVLGALWLWRRQPWGYVVATILNVSFTVEMLALTVGAFPKAEAGIWACLGIAGLTASLVVLRSLRHASR